MDELLVQFDEARSPWWMLTDAGGDAVAMARGSGGGWSPPAAAAVRPLKPEGGPREHYAVAHLRECLAEDPRINELDIVIEKGAGKTLFLRGQVQGLERRALVETVAREKFPEW